MITPEEIATKAARHYVPLLRGWLRGEPFAPLSFSAGAPPSDYQALRSTVDRVIAGAKGPRRHGYRVEVETRRTRAFGAQSLPTRIVIDTAEDLLYLAEKADEFAAFREDVARIRAALPRLEGWLLDNPQHVITYHGLWPDLLNVCTYFLAHARPGCYIRELPIEVHTKFIETHTGILRRLLDALLPPEAIVPTEASFERRYGLRTKEPLVRLRFLDPAGQARCGVPLSDLSAPVSQLAALALGWQRCLIVENEMTFLTLPPLPATLALLGSGFAVEALGGLPWLHTCSLWYWGDLDAQGFQILSRLRALFPQAVSLLMDVATLDAFRAFAGAGTPCLARELPHLTPDEQALFAYLADTQTRLEQERIGYAYVNERLRILAKPGS